jgi:hypothetical protein
MKVQNMSVMSETRHKLCSFVENPERGNEILKETNEKKEKLLDVMIT